MATSATSPRQSAARTPSRTARVRNTTEAMEPPQKKRRYIAGGPGGGGRWIDQDGNELDPSECPPPVRSQRKNRLQAPRPARRDTAEDGDAPATVPRAGVSTRPRRERIERWPSQATPRPRYSSAAAAAAASQASDGYKPREERSWEDFHPDMDIDAKLLVFSADTVDGRKTERPLLTHVNSTTKAGEIHLDGDTVMKDASAEDEMETHIMTTPKRKPGRPPRRPESMLSGLGSPPAPRIMPLPTHNPKERLNLPKPSFRQYNHFLQYEENHKENRANYVDRSMSHVGYQETDRYELPPAALVRLSEGPQVEDEAEVNLKLESDGPFELTQANANVSRVEYDMDEQDMMWLEDLNEQRKTENAEPIKPAIFEIVMTQIEKEYHALEKRIPKPQPRHAQMHRPRSSSQAAVNGDPNPPGDEPDSKCSICDDGDCENANAIIFCDGCDLAVHQECYGVPFIPEGQWFCRKCKEIGRGTPTCLFCPNVDGAFKQTNTMRWSHLLCAIWIPEVTIANMTFMEPIMDVDKVPKSRWKLHCYICQQKMGACIQCGNKNCYQAFHVTCARRAKLFLKMKSQNQQGIDTSALKAFCDKHVSPEWRRTHDTDNATIEAKRWYRHAFKDRRWADSQTAALELGAPLMPDGGLAGDASAVPDGDTIAVKSNRRRNNQLQKLSWRLPSGAPVVPAAVFNTVDTCMQRFTIRKRKEFVEKACRYWTLKREARRGAALLKRLQLQLEGFSTMEVTRRNFAGMGAAGRPRLLRRIDFAEMLQKDMGHLRQLCTLVKKREELRLKEVELLRELLDTVYFPVSAMLAPILHKAMRIDEKTRYFGEGFDKLALRLRERFYTSVTDFSRDLGEEIKIVIARISGQSDSGHTDIETIHSQLYEVKPGTAEHHALSNEQKEIKKLSKRLIKAVREMLQDAAKKEAELKGEQEDDFLKKLDSMPLFAAAKSLENDAAGAGDAANGKMLGKRRSASDASAVAGALPNDTVTANGDEEMRDADQAACEGVLHVNVAGEKDTVAVPAGKQTPHSKTVSNSSSEHHRTAATASGNEPKPTEPLSPPISTNSAAQGNGESTTANGAAVDAKDVFASGGVPWYLGPFDVEGTTVHEERYTGRDVLRGMSEELSDMDEDTLTELVPNGVSESSAQATPDGKIGNGDGAGGSTKKRNRNGTFGRIGKKGKSRRR
ncbi:hypothetical protein EJ03DRAFT_301722 [Teratosphaeria nubilosa]|uniref:PHD finger domain-containing protein n=1 Tax=Teratosphaeria nubilosa TaxID=161662 RepID=A0A6G1KVF1_9PEZI|nr:hypothetical protein EJ03DRAFT_301722 [Teratosphaeria nubilosa]